MISLTISADNVTRILFGWWKSLFSRGVTVSYNATNLPLTNRAIVSAWDTGMKINGVSDILERISSLLENGKANGGTGWK